MRYERFRNSSSSKVEDKNPAIIATDRQQGTPSIKPTGQSDTGTVQSTV